MLMAMIISGLTARGALSSILTGATGGAVVLAFLAYVALRIAFAIFGGDSRREAY